MLFYIILMVFLIASLFQNKYQIVFAFLSILQMILIGFFRFGVGTDYFSYKNAITLNFYWFSDKSFSYISNFALKQLNLEPVIILGFWSVFTLVCIIYFLKKYSDSINAFSYSLFFFVSLYYYLDSFNIIRQYIALSIFLMAFIFLMKNKIFMYLVLGLISAYFHVSSGLFVILFLFINYFLKKRTLNYSSSKILLLGSVFFILGFIDSTVIIQKIFEIFNYNGRLDYYLLYSFDKYLNYDMTLPLILFLVFKFFIFYIVVINYRKNSKGTHAEKVIFYVYVMSALLSFVFYPILLLRRTLIYLTIFEVIVFGKVISQSTMWIKVVLISVSLVYFWLSIKFGYSTPLPFKIWIDTNINF